MRLAAVEADASTGSNDEVLRGVAHLDDRTCSSSSEARDQQGRRRRHPKVGRGRPVRRRIVVPLCRGRHRGLDGVEPPPPVPVLVAMTRHPTTWCRTTRPPTAATSMSKSVALGQSTRFAAVPVPSLVKVIAFAPTLIKTAKRPANAVRDALDAARRGA